MMKQKKNKGYKFELTGHSQGAIPTNLLLDENEDIDGIALNPAYKLGFISPTHKRTEGRAPCGALSLLQKDAALQGGYSRKRCRLNVKLRTSVTA
jgi:hypothetical protein